MTRADLKEALSHVYDIERLTTRILYGSATPKEVKALGDTCVYLPQVRQLARQCTTPLLQELSGAVDPLEDLLNLINRALVEDPPANLKDGGAIRAGSTPKWTSCGISCTAARASFPSWKPS